MLKINNARKKHFNLNYLKASKGLLRSLSRERDASQLIVI